MIKQYYFYHSSKNKTRFFFESKGAQGNVIKVIEFRDLGNDRWNLGFGDWKNGQIDGKIITNNRDTIKVISTVAKAAFDFINEYPNRIIVINPVDDKRKLLYNRVFQRNIKDIETLFVVTGFIEKKGEIYISEKIYDSFEIKLKFEL